jgi:hypothetical protein
MERLEGTTGIALWLAEISPGDDAVVSPFEGAEFALMLVDFTGDVTPIDRARLARRFVEQGCRYAVCAGTGSDEWETAFDEADLETNPTCSRERFVMTTSHLSESLEEVAWFLLRVTATADFTPVRFLAIGIGAAPSELDNLRLNLLKASRNSA